MLRHCRLLIVFALPLLGASCITGSAVRPPAVPALAPLKSVYRINVTSQPHDFYSPWQKKKHFSRTAVATVVGPNLLLVTGSMVYDHTYVELEKLDSGAKTPAKVLCVDHEANLALVCAQQPEFVADASPLPLLDKMNDNAEIKVWQFEDNGTPLITKGEFRRAEVVVYPYSQLLAYQVNISLPSFARPDGTPAVCSGRLAGILLNYSSNTQQMQLIPAEIIQHFLSDFRDGKYDGFPQAGFGYTRLDDPQLRDYVALPEDRQGVYITYVRPTSPAAWAGIKNGDVLLAIDAYTIDRLGQYEDPDYGKLNLSHLITTRSFAGDARTCRVWRDGKELTLTMKLKVLSIDEFPIAPYIFDRGPDYVVTGGLVFMELSRQFLKEWGGDWSVRAPPRLVHYDRNQWELFRPGTRLVLLTRILRTQANAGYGQYQLKILRKVNGLAITCLSDLPKALARPIKGGFHYFEFDSPTEILVLDAKEVQQADEVIKQYVPELQHLTE